VLNPPHGGLIARLIQSLKAVSAGAGEWLVRDNPNNSRDERKGVEKGAYPFDEAEKQLMAFVEKIADLDPNKRTQFEQLVNKLVEVVIEATRRECSLDQIGAATSSNTRSATKHVAAVRTLIRADPTLRKEWKRLHHDSLLHKTADEALVSADIALLGMVEREMHSPEDLIPRVKVMESALDLRRQKLVADIIHNVNEDGKSLTPEFVEKLIIAAIDLDQTEIGV